MKPTKANAGVSAPVGPSAQPPPQPAMRIARAAALLGVSTTTLYNDAKAGAEGISLRGGAWHVDFPRYNAWRQRQGLSSAPATTLPAAAREPPPPADLARGGRPAQAEVPTIDGKTMAQLRLEREALELSKDRREHDREGGKLVNADEVKAAWLRGLTEIGNALQEAPHKAVEKVREPFKLTPPQAAELSKAIERAINDTLAAFVERDDRKGSPREDRP